MHSKKCATNLRHDNQVFCNFGSFILLSVIVFACLKMLMIPNDSYWVAMKVVPLIILATSSWVFIQLIGLVQTN
jgi:hypothetical protein